MYDISLTDSFFPAYGGREVEPITIGDMLRNSAMLYGDTHALRALSFTGDIERSWTYSQLLQDSERLARALASRHDKGARIAVWAPNLPEWVLLEFAAAMAGLTLVTVNPAYQARELKYVLEQSGSEAIYYVAEFRGNPMQAIADEVCDAIPAIRQRIRLDDHQAMFAGEETGELPQVAPGDAAQIQYTSGTTGFPKGAVLHHTGLVRNAMSVMERFQAQPGEVMIHYMPLFHTAGCGILVLGGISGGATILLAPAFDPAIANMVIEREKATSCFGVPTMLVALIEEASSSGRDVSSIRHIVSGGSMVAPELVRQTQEVYGASLQIVYGQTESSPVITMVWPEDSMEDLTETAGQALPHIDLAILDPQTNEIMPVGAQGEICARGYLVMTGYNDNAEATAEAIDDQGWLHTGDLGRMDARGYLKITGRVKEMIIRAGENLFPAEIENALLEHDAVAEIAVIGVPDEKWGEQVACFIRPQAGAPPDAAELKAFIRARLSAQKTPAFWIFVEDWPLTGSGKIQKFKLAEGFEQGLYDVQSV